MKMLWLTQKGEIALQIKQEKSGNYSYIGKYGAGSGMSKDEVAKTVQIMCMSHPKVKPA